MSEEDRTQLSAIERERIILRQGMEQDPRTIRIAGIVGMALGLVLIMIIGAVAYYTVPIMLADGETIDGSRFTGGPGARIAIFAIYAAVAAIGFTAMLSGAMHIATGRRFTPGVRVMMWFASLLLLSGVVVRLIA